MKKTLFIAASALSMVVAAPAFAQTGNSESINLTANVGKACGVGNHLSGAMTGTGDQSDIVIDDLADEQGQFNAAKTFNRSFGNVWCNGPATVTIAATKLATTESTTDLGSFTNAFDLEVSGGAMIYADGGTLNTAIAGQSSKSNGINQAFETGLGAFSSVDIKVQPSLTGNGRAKRPVAGLYKGTVTITATAG